MLAVVTGASSGIGQAFAERLAADGWDVVVVARRRDRLLALAQRLREQFGVRVQVYVADLSAADDVPALERTLESAGVEMLVNNAGFAGYAPFVEVEPDVLARLLGVHVMAVSRLTRAAVPTMVARGSGAVINVASLLAFSATLPPRPWPYRVTYAGAKAYLVAFTQALAGELAGTGVHVQVCCPGLVATEFHDIAGVDLAGIPFPIMQPSEIVRASLQDLGTGEVVCVPGLQDTTLLEASEESQRTLLLNAVASGLADRYQPT